jgi:hypothetical protein
MRQRYVNTASTPGGDGTTNATSGASRAFADLREGMLSLGSGTLPEAYTFDCDGSGGADTSDLGQTAWNFRTTLSENLLVRALGSQRATGVWSDSRYRISATNRGPGAVYSNLAAHVRFDGLQMEHIVNDGSSGKIVFKGANGNQVDADGEMYLTNCVVRGVATNGSTIVGVESRPADPSGFTQSFHWNVVVYGCQQAFTNDNAVAYYMNCTAARGQYGFVENAEQTMIVINCLVTNFTDIPFVGTFHPVSSNNACEGGASIPGFGYNDQTFTFEDAASDDYRLAEEDEGARNLGDNTITASYFTNDIAGNDRTILSPWDIGAFEYALGGGLPQPGGGGSTVGERRGKNGRISIARGPWVTRHKR